MSGMTCLGATLCLGLGLTLAACDGAGDPSVADAAHDADADVVGAVAAPPFDAAGEGAPALRFEGYSNVTVVGKPGLAVPVGGALTVEARELVGGSYGRSTELRWRSLDPQLLTVVPVREGSANGHAQARLYGLATGIAEIVVEGDDAAPGRLVVRVLPEAEVAALEGVPAGAEFAVPMIADPSAALIRVALHDVTGAVVAEIDALDGTRTGELARLTFDAESGMEVDADALRATPLRALEVRRLWARWDGERLPGAQLVVRVPEAADPACPSGAPPERRAFWCDVAGVPARFGAPGERAGAMVTVAQLYTEGGDFACPALARAPPVLIRRQAPDRLAWSDAGVVTVGGDGLLVALAPGTTELWAGLGPYDCGTATVSVLPRLEGTWRVTCDDGGQGVVRLVGGLEEVSLESPQEAVFRSLLPISRARGESCMTGAGACVGEASAWASTPSADPETFAAFHGPCSAALPCHGAGVTRCGGDGPTPVAIVGPDELRGGGCVYTRVAPGEAAGVCTPGLEGER